MDNRIEALERLTRLREQNALSEREFETEKGRLLSFGVELPIDPLGNRPVAKGLSLPVSLGLAGLVVAISTGLFLAKPSLVTGDGTADRTQSLAGTSKATKGRDSQVTLTSILAFDNAGDCTLDKRLKDVIADMRALKPGDGKAELTMATLAGRHDVVIRRVEDGPGSGSVIAELEAQGSWEGLQVTGLRTVNFPEEEHELFQVRFSDGAAKVQRVLREQGLKLPKVGDVKNVETTDNKGLVVGIESFPNGSALTCARTVS